MTKQTRIDFPADKQILGLLGEYAFLANSYPTPIVFTDHDQHGEREYASAEHAYQAHKAANPKAFAAIATAASPEMARELGHKVAVREGWKQLKLPLMQDLVFRKFSSNPELMSRLLDLQNYYIEHSNDWNDRYWGVCDGSGANHLGQILMQTRDLLAVGESMKKLIEETKSMISRVKSGPPGSER